MKVNIFGVGRSGTKAVQLWVSYVLARRYGEVWITYEPFQYQNRKLEPSALGKYLHESLPLIFYGDQPNTKLFEYYINNICSYPVSVNKYIRANGRVNLINDLTKPDLAILVVRDLYQVLESIAVRDWGLVESTSAWDRLCRWSRELFPFLEKSGCLKPTTDKLLKSAVFWFVMNQYALENIKDTYLIDYERLEIVENLFTNLGFQELPNIRSNPMFRGDNIHRNYPLLDIREPQTGDLSGKSVFRKAVINLDRITNKRFPQCVQFPIRLLSTQIVKNFPPAGTMCCVNKDMIGRFETSISPIPKSNVAVSHTDFFDELNLRVKNSLESVIHRQDRLIESSR